MPRSWQYSRYRRAIMQGVMWIILGATVGLAALQTRQHPAGRRVTVGMTQYLMGPLRIRAPEGWLQDPEADGLVLHEPPNPNARTMGEEGGRVLQVKLERVNPHETPTTYLAGKADLKALPDPKPIVMCGQQGLLFALPEIIGEGEGAAIVAGTVLPPGRGVTVTLHVPHEVTQLDVALLKDIATTMVYEPKPPANDGETERPENSD